MLLGCLFPAVANAAPARDMLTEQRVRELHIEHPDSCLHLLDRAEQGKIATDIPAYKMDILRAMCYEIKGAYPEKEQCVRRLLANDSIRHDPGRRLKATVLLAGVLECQSKYEEAIAACRSAIDLARRTGHKKEEAEMFSTMGRIYAAMKDNARADASFRRAIALLQTTDDVREMANLSTIYGEYMTFQADAARLKDAIATGRRRQALIDRMSALPGPPPGYIDQQRGFLYAKMALLLCDDHRPNEAAALYDQYRRLDFAGTYTGRLFSVPYLLRAGRYADALSNNSQCLNDFHGDTLSYDYLLLLQQQSAAHRGLSDFRAADAYMLRCYALQDSIYARESRTKAQEYASLFDSQEKELELTRTRAQSQRKTILIGASLALIALLLLILWAVIRNLRIMKQRNRIEAQRIDELLSQKQELRKIYAASAPDTAPAASAPDATTPAADTADAPDHEYQTFIRMENTIVENRLFLNSKISREDILRATGVGKNTLVPLIKKYAGSVNLNEYINRLRLEHAVRLLRDNRVYTVDYIAEASGFNSRSTFYRVFQNIYGMTPLAVPRHPLQAGTLTAPPGDTSDPPVSHGNNAGRGGRDAFREDQVVSRRSA